MFLQQDISEFMHFTYILHEFIIHNLLIPAGRPFSMLISFVILTKAWLLTWIQRNFFFLSTIRVFLFQLQHKIFHSCKGLHHLNCNPHIYL